VVITGVTTGPASKVGFDLLLMFHVAAALVGFGALAVSGVQAGRLARQREGGLPDDLRRYFDPGVNWAGRILYLVPVLGAALVGDGGFSFGDPFVVVGLALWSLGAAVAEGVLWPAERRLQRAVTDGYPQPTVGESEVLRDCRRVSRASAFLVALFVAATVVMVARPS